MEFSFSQTEPKYGDFGRTTASRVKQSWNITMGIDSKVRTINQKKQEKDSTPGKWMTEKVKSYTGENSKKTIYKAKQSFNSRTDKNTKAA